MTYANGVGLYFGFVTNRTAMALTFNFHDALRGPVRRRSPARGDRDVHDAYIAREVTALEALIPGLAGYFVETRRSS